MSEDAADPPAPASASGTGGFSDGELVDRLFLRVASADTDARLQSVLARCLTPALLHLNSQQPGVRQQMLELLVHVNKRLRSGCSTVQLPLDQLLQQYAQPDATAFVRNFAIIYIRMAFERLSPGEQYVRALSTLSVLEGAPVAHLYSILPLIVYALSRGPSTTNSTDIAESGTDPDSNQVQCVALPVAIRDALLEHVQDVLLLPYTIAANSSGTPTSQPIAENSGTSTAAVPEGLSSVALTRVMTGQSLWFQSHSSASIVSSSSTSQQLERVKCGLVRWLASLAATLRSANGDQWPVHWLLPAVLVATSDTRLSVVDAANDAQRAIMAACSSETTVGSMKEGSSAETASVDTFITGERMPPPWERPAVIRRLYRLYLGDVKVGGATSSSAVPADQRRRAAPVRLKLRLLTVLAGSHSACVTGNWPQAVHVILDGTFGDPRSDKLRLQSVLFAERVVQAMPFATGLSSPKYHVGVAKLLMGCVRRLITELSVDSNGVNAVASVNSARLLEATYTLLTKLCLRVPQLVANDIEFVCQLLATATKATTKAPMDDREQREVELSASTLTAVLRSPLLQLVDDKWRTAFETSLIKIHQKPYECRSTRVRRLLVDCWSLVYSVEHARSRFYLLLLASEAVGSDSGECVDDILNSLQPQNSCPRTKCSSEKETVDNVLEEPPEFGLMLSTIGEESTRSSGNNDKKWRLHQFTPHFTDLLIRYLSVCLRWPRFRPNLTEKYRMSAKGISVQESCVHGRSAKWLSHVLSDSTLEPHIRQYIRLIGDELISSKNSSVVARLPDTSLFCLLEVLASCEPASCLSHLRVIADDNGNSEGVCTLEWFRKLLTAGPSGASGSDWRQYAAELFGVVVSVRFNDSIDLNAVIPLIMRDWDKQSGSTVPDVYEVRLFTVTHCINCIKNAVHSSDKTDKCLVDFLRDIFTVMIGNHLESVEASSQHISFSAVQLISAACSCVTMVACYHDHQHLRLQLPAVLMSQTLIDRLLKVACTSSFPLALRCHAMRALASSCVVTGDVKPPTTDQNVAETGVLIASRAEFVCRRLMERWDNFDELHLQIVLVDTLVTIVLAPWCRTWLQKDQWRPTERQRRPQCEAVGWVSSDTSHQQKLFEWLYQQLTNGANSDKDQRRRLGSCLGLLRLLQMMSTSHWQPPGFPMLERLESIQRQCVLPLLADSNREIREIASKTLAYIHNAALILKQETNDVGDKLLDSAICWLTSGSSTNVNQVYRQLAALASRLSQPNLFHRFTSIAEQSSIWSMWRSLADQQPFDISPWHMCETFPTVSANISIASDTDNAATGIGNIDEKRLVAVLPWLYRTQHEPDVELRTVMRAVWQRLIIADGRSANGAGELLLRRHVDVVYHELITCLAEYDWRVRQSASAALSQLLTVTNVAPTSVSSDGCVGRYRLPHASLWPALVRVSDDTRTSVRKEAQLALQRLANCLESAVMHSDSPLDAAHSQQTLDDAMPVLIALIAGESSVVCCAEARQICVDLLAKIVAYQQQKQGSEYLEKHLPQLVPALLVQLSEIEPKELQRLHVQLSGRNDGLHARRQLENSRLFAVQQTSVYRTLMLCARHVHSADQLLVLADRLATLMRRNNGLVTHCGVALFIESVCSQQGRQLTADITWSGQPAEVRQRQIRRCFSSLLAALCVGLQQRSATVRQCCARACGVVCVHGGSCSRLISKLRQWYWDWAISGGAAHDSGSGASASIDSATTEQFDSAVCAAVMTSLCRHASEQLHSQAAGASISLVYVASHESSSESQKQWLDIWSELLTAGGISCGTAMRLHYEEIVELCVKFTSCQVWSVRSQGARSLSGCVTALISASSFARDTSLQASTENTSAPSQNVTLEARDSSVSMTSHFEDYKPISTLSSVTVSSPFSATSSDQHSDSQTVSHGDTSNIAGGSDVSNNSKKQCRSSLPEVCESNARKVLLLDAATAETISTTSLTDDVNPSIVKTPNSAGLSHDDERKSGSDIIGRVVSAVDCLLAMLPGRLWTGKESVLEALSAICVSANKQEHHALLPSGQAERLVDALLAEAAKSSVDIRYRMCAVRCVSRCLRVSRVNRLIGLCTLTDNALNCVKDNSTDCNGSDWLKLCLEAMSDALSIECVTSSRQSVELFTKSIILMQRCFKSADNINSTLASCLCTMIEGDRWILNAEQWRHLLQTVEVSSLYSDSIRGMFDILACLVRALTAANVRHRAISALLSANVAILRCFESDVSLLNCSTLKTLCSEIASIISADSLQECIASVENLKQLKNHIDQFNSLVSDR